MPQVLSHCTIVCLRWKHCNEVTKENGWIFKWVKLFDKCPNNKPLCNQTIRRDGNAKIIWIGKNVLEVTSDCIIW